MRPLPLSPLPFSLWQVTDGYVGLLCTPYSFVSYRTNQYKLHYFETPTNIKFVMLTDLKSPSMRLALEQIYINLYVEYGMRWRTYTWISGLTGLFSTVVKNPLSPVEHPGGVGVNNELFEESLEQFVVCGPVILMSCV